MRMRLVTVALGVLALGVAVALVHLRPQAPEGPTPPVRASVRTLPGPSTPTPPPRGALSIQGRVVDARGNPAAGVEVSATRAMPGESLSQLPCDARSPTLKLSSSECQGTATEVLMELIEVERGGAPVLALATTSPDGTFQLEALPEGTVTLWAIGAQGSAMKLDVRTGTDGVELVLETSVSLPGRVVGESGAPLAGAKVTLFDHEGSRYFELRTGPDGRFAFGPLPDVSYGLVASSPGLLPKYLPDVSAVELEEDLVLHPPRRLVGKVLAEDRPVVGARVRVEGTSHVTTTDAQGRFSVEPLPPGEYAVLGEHAGQHGVARVSIQDAPETETTVYLGTLFFIEGTVSDEAGSPVGGAHVTTLLRRELLNPAPVTTSADGRFRLGPLPAGPARIVVESDRYLDLEHEEPDLAPSGPPLDLVLTPAVIVEGVVTDTEGRPLEDVDLDAALKEDPDPEEEEADGAPLELLLEGSGDSTFTSSDAAGRFRLKLAEPGRYVIGASGIGHVPVRLEVDTPATGLHIALRGGASAEGTVVDARGEPLPEVELRVRFGTGSGAQVLFTLSDDEGHFLLEGLPPGTHTLEAKLELAGARHEASRTVEVRGPGTVEAHLRMDTGGSVSGLVVDEQGRPLADAEVEAYVFSEFSDDYLGGSPASAKTGPDGRFTVHHLLEGPCLLRASKDGYALDDSAREPRSGFHASTRTGARDVRLVLRYQGSVSGRVVRADGAPLTGLSVQIGSNRVIEPGDDGTFRAPVERAGREVLNFRATGVATLFREVEVALGQDLDLGEVRLESGRRVSGRLVDAETGAPIGGADVLVGTEGTASSEESARVLMRAETEVDGTFEFTSLEARPATLTVQHRGYLHLRQDLGAGDERLELRLSRGARVEGLVRDREGRLVETTVRLTSQSHESRRLAAMGARTNPHHISLVDSAAMMQLEGLHLRVTSTGGAFSARGLQPGEYSVEADETKAPDGRRVRFFPQRVHIPASGTVALSLTELPGDATLRAVLRLEPPEKFLRIHMGLLRGQLPPEETYDELLLWLRSQDLPSTYDEAGRAQVYEHLPAGRYTFLVLLMVNPERFLAGSVEVDVPASGVITQEIHPVYHPLPATR